MDSKGVPIAVVLFVLVLRMGKAADSAVDSHLYAISLHVTIIELLGACIALVQTNRSIGIPILLRSMYEALVELDNLVHLNGYYKHMEAANLKQVIKAAKSPLLATLFDGSHGRTKADLDALTAELGKLKSEGKDALGIWRRFKMAGRSEEFDSLYALFCLDTHNNLTALADRHGGSLGEGPPEISIFGEPYAPSVTLRLRFGVSFLIQSAEMIHGAFGAQSPAIEQLRREHEARRERLPVVR